MVSRTFKQAYLAEFDMQEKTMGTSPAPENKDSILSHEGKKYLRNIRSPLGSIIQVDVYAVLKAFNVTCPATAHAIKKLLCAGQRGKGKVLDDLIGAKAALCRAIELAHDDTPIEELQQARELRELRLKGYDGKPCPKCGSLHTVISGSVWACDTCNSRGAYNADKHPTLQVPEPPTAQDMFGKDYGPGGE